ncbi:MAG: DUF975 family protein [Firmicutes bacterium]|nr:DUF975 family protein [Bacillota bacterium]MBQ6089377.1 DUF975 family protein [Bacillota bacterium]MBQ6607763.1 DUF975 family protein [Bacillota bacterium]
MEKIKHEQRVEIKKRAKDVVRSHFILLVIICLVVSYYGTDLNFVTDNVDTLWKLVTGQPIEFGDDSLKIDKSKTSDKVLQDLIDDNYKAGKTHAAIQLEEYRQEKLTNDVNSRKNGIFAAVANNISSGNLYMIIFEGLHSVIHSTRVTSAIIVFFSMMAAIALWIFIKNMLGAIMRRVFLEARLYKTVPVSHMLHFKLVKRWFRASMTLLLTTIFQYLWFITVIGGFIKMYSYRMVPFIVAENPDLKPREAITLSRRMMNGHKWECFVLDMTFVGWYILGTFTFGLITVLWAAPYSVATYAEYYTELRNGAKAAGIENADRLNDTYLFEYAEEGFLRKTYSDVEEQKHFIDEHRVELPPVRGFIAKNFGLWIGPTEEKAMYDEVDKRRQQIVEDRAVIKHKIYPQRLNPLWDDKNNNIVKDIRSIRTYTIWSVIMVFFAFAFVGWCWEVGIHLIQDGVFVNRGVMHGPWLPIYGGGVAMIVVLLAKWRRNPLQEVVSIIILCGIVEYTTSWYLEVTKGMRWWDYTGYFLNLNGRICGEGLMVFALGGMAAVYLLVPVLDTMWSKLKPKVLAGICIVLLVCFAADMIYTQLVPNVGDGITDYAAYTEIETNDSSGGGN